MKVKYLVLYFFLHITSLGYLAQLHAQCTGTSVLTNHAATFEDGSGTANYQNNLNCGWRIAVPGATRIELTITGSTEATNDYLKIYNGYDATATLLATKSGSFPNQVVTSTICISSVLTKCNFFWKRVLAISIFYYFCPNKF